MSGRDQQGVSVNTEQCGDLGDLICPRPGSASFPAADGLLPDPECRSQFCLLSETRVEPSLAEDGAKGGRVQFRNSSNVLRYL